MVRMAKRSGEDFVYTGFIEAETILSVLSLPGEDGDPDNYAETPQDVAFDVLTGDIDFRMHLKMPDFSPSVGLPHNKMINKRDAGANERSWEWRADSNGTHVLQVFQSGVGPASFQFTASNEVPEELNNTFLWLRWALVLDNGNNEKQATFFYSLDGALWVVVQKLTQAGVMVDVAAGNASNIGIGGNSNDTNPRLKADILEVQIRNGIGGPLAFNPLFKDQAPGTLVFPDSISGADVTIIQEGTPQAEIVASLQVEQDRDAYGDVEFVADADPPTLRGIRSDQTNRTVLMASGEERKVDIAVLVPNPLKDSNGVTITVQDDMTDRAATLIDGSGRTYKVIGVGHEAENPVGATRLMCMRQTN